MKTLSNIEQRIRVAELESQRRAGSVRLIAVSKVQPRDRVAAVLEAGHRCFGENRIQEAQKRWEPFRETYDDLELHLIGPLQTNKIKPALALFDVIQTLDRDRLARKISDEIQRIGDSPEFYVQVNTGDEAQKAGISPAKADAFINACRDEYDLPVIGVMAIPPADEDPVPHFELLADIGQRNGLDGLSMGMSADFETAIKYGATCVRVGSALFGARDPSALSG